MIRRIFKESSTVWLSVIDWRIGTFATRINMATFIPTECDYYDAHGNSKEIEKYLDFKEKSRMDPSLKHVFPWSFEVVEGFFQQADPSVDDQKFDYVAEDFGRMRPWNEILSALDEMNATAPSNVAYKLLFCARHGQGYHNVIYEKYGHVEWEAKWGALYSDADIVYGPDPELTAVGIEQAKANHRAWKRQIILGAPVPDVFYSSPLQRSCFTLHHTWQGIRPEHKQPVIKEILRETIGVDTCDQRSSKLVIDQRFGHLGYVVEDGFSEMDQLWDAHDRETYCEQTIRIDRFFQELFEQEWDDELGRVGSKHSSCSVVSTTTHAGTIRCMLLVAGHRPFAISTGGMVPVVVRGTRRA